MLYTVSDFQRLYADSLRLVAGQGGLARTIDEVGILDYELMPGLRDKYQRKNLAPRQLVLSTFLYAKDDPYLIGDAVRTLVAEGASALVIKNALHLPLPESALRYANARNLPLFVVQSDGFFFDQVIVEVTGRIRDLGSASFAANQIDLALREDASPREVRECALAINPSFEERVACLYLRLDEEPDPQELSRIEAAFLRSSLAGVGSALVCYHRGILAIVTTDPEERIDLAGCMEVLRSEVLAGAGASAGGRPQPLGVTADGSLPSEATPGNGRPQPLGASSVHLGLEDFAQALHEALWASAFAGQDDMHAGRSLRFDALGVEKALLPFVGSSQMAGYSHSLMEPLKEFDAAHEGQLMATLACFLREGQSVGRCAQELGQHQNTIRYRLDRIAQVTGLSPRKSEQMEQLALAWRVMRCREVLGLD